MKARPLANQPASPLNIVVPDDSWMIRYGLRKESAAKAYDAFNKLRDILLEKSSGKKVLGLVVTTTESSHADPLLRTEDLFVNINKMAKVTPEQFLVINKITGDVEEDMPGSPKVHKDIDLQMITTGFNALSQMILNECADSKKISKHLEEALPAIMQLNKFEREFKLAYERAKTLRLREIEKAKAQKQIAELQKKLSSSSTEILFQKLQAEIEAKESASQKVIADLKAQSESAILSLRQRLEAAGTNLCALQGENARLVRELEAAKPSAVPDSGELGGLASAASEPLLPQPARKPSMWSYIAGGALIGVGVAGALIGGFAMLTGIFTIPGFALFAGSLGLIVGGATLAGSAVVIGGGVALNIVAAKHDAQERVELSEDLESNLSLRSLPRGRQPAAAASTVNHRSHPRTPSPARDGIFGGNTAQRDEAASTAAASANNRSKSGFGNKN